ncbi:MAG: CoA transferase [Alphaproteobacteria bacterium]|nr:CoA transferase [Alphaproteobacteria bacterium]
MDEEAGATDQASARRRTAAPLAGISVVEFPAIGPVPFCGMVLADMGAAVVRIDRVGASGLGIGVPARYEVLHRGKQSVALDLKQAEGARLARRLVARSNVLLEGFRPGVMERLGLGPAECLGDNPKLVYGRMSGWGEKGPLAGAAGHDINYIGLSGALAAMGEPGAPPPVPLNLIGDFGGAAMHLAAGVLAALLAVRAGGAGQVVRTSIAEAALALMPMIYGLRAAGEWGLERGRNILDGGAPFYRTYATRDGRFVAVGAIEAKFYAALVEGLGLAERVSLAAQRDRATWPATTALFAARFAEQTRDEWAAAFAGRDACVTPVLDMDEAPAHPQLAALGAFATVADIRQPAPTPEFSGLDARAPGTPPQSGADTTAILAKLGCSEAEIARLLREGIARAA